MTRWEDHIGALCAEGRVEWRPRKSGGGRASRRGRWIHVPPIRSQRGYFTALHELGHVLGPQPRTRLAKEAAAWQWALAHAIEEPTEGTLRMIARCLDSYQAWAERRGGGQGCPTPADDAFLAFRNRFPD